MTVPVVDLVKHKYGKKNKNWNCKKEEAKLKEEDDNEAMRQSTMISINQCTRTMISANQYASKKIDCSRYCSL